MLRNLATSLFMHRKIETTETRAKEVARFAQRLISLAKRGDLAAKRAVFQHIKNKDVARELFETIAPQYRSSGEHEERKGGYTRILRLGQRKGDAAPMVVLELV
jgi:large subunit ribosomal protein L17